MFEKKLRTIAELREHRRECDETLYRNRIDLHRTSRQLRRAGQGQTVINSERDQTTATLRTRIARLDARLVSLRGENRKVEERHALLARQGQLTKHLELNLTAAKDRNGKLLEQLTELLQQELPRTETIHSIEAELNKLKSLLSNLNGSQALANEILNELQDEEPAQIEKQKTLQSEMEKTREEMRGLQGNLTELLQPTFADTVSLQHRHTELKSTSRQSKIELIDCSGKLNAAIDGLYRESSHPKELLRNLDDQTPFLLFPVKLETIFAPIQSPGGVTRTELWVRVYPDDIAIHTHEKILTDREIVAGELYWTELVTAEHLRSEQDNRRRSAWRHLVDLFGGQRAAWVARQTKPSDWETLTADGIKQTLLDFLRAGDANFFNDLLAQAFSENTRAALQKAVSANDGDAFSRVAESEHWFGRVNIVVSKGIKGFPVHELTKTDGWTRAPRTQILPDRFVLLLYGKKTDKPREIPGALIPDTLFLGPDPMDAEAGFKPKGGALTFGGEFDWMSDFDQAVKQGMGFRVALTEEEAINGFERILTLGVFLSADAVDSAKMIEELIDNHQFSPNGFSLVPQGTPTNNTERNGTGYSDNDSYNDLAFFTGIDPPAFNPADPDAKKSRTDARLLADALGIAYAPLQTVRYAEQTDVLEAQAMNTALFPGTLGYWLKTWMSPVVTEQAARQTRSFFIDFVSGRGPLPSVRVGNQPYGVLLTSDFSRWKYPDTKGDIAFIRTFDDETFFLKKLHSLLVELEDTWRGISGDLPFVGKQNSDSSVVLMNILGLHPTSVEYFQRIGFSDEYLKNKDSFETGGKYANELTSLLLSMPPTARLALRNLGFEEEAVSSMRSLHVLWQHYVTPLDVPNLIENIPPSETKPLTLNYIDWLFKAANTDVIIKQDFKSSPPTALLYLMLRNALLLQLYHGSYEWLKERTIFDSPLEKAIGGNNTLPGVRITKPVLSKYELLATRVEAAEPTHPLLAESVANLIWFGPNPVEIEAAFLREQKSALPMLTDVPTAKLERCFIEHLDCCNYRLDAWQTGIFAQRLQAQRRSGKQNNERQMGIFLGAFGWIENLKPLPKTFLNPENLPSSLRPDDSHPVIEENDSVISGVASHSGSRQGGFVHAPSLNHASAAALLRNAYLSHADPEQAEIFSVNLSSERVRRAEFLLEGLRNGQPIEALLGYQFERGLHDRTSESAARRDVQVLELNQFILSYRQAFPFESREVAQSGNVGAVETVPANSVVNGLRLAQASLLSTNGYGLSGINPPVAIPDINQGQAILAEQNHMLDSLDAVKDLLMAENAYQLVLGNFDRVAAVSLAQKDAHIPPEMQVINTPRGTEFTFTNRVTLHFDDLDPSLITSNPWQASHSPMTPRASAETGMNHWLGQVLGKEPGKVHCSVFWTEKTPDGKDSTPRDRHTITLADIKIQPVDFVWMVSITPEETGGATELETRIAFSYRSKHIIADDKTVRIEFHPLVAEDEKTFAQLFPLARQLRALLGSCRALNALDFLPAAGGKATSIPIDKNNPKGYDQAELRSRVQSILTSLETQAEALDGTTAPKVDLVFINESGDIGDDEVFSGKLGEAYKKLEAVKLTFTDVDKVRILSFNDAKSLHERLRVIASFAIADAYPPQSDLGNDAARMELLARAHRVARRLRREDPRDGILDRAKEAFNKASTNKTIEEQMLSLLQAGKILFGETFDWLPKFTYHNEIDLATATTARKQLLKHAVAAIPGITEEEVVEEWLQGLARVRPNLHRWEVVRMLTDTLNDQALELRPTQVPFRANDSWLAVEFPEKDPNDPEKIKPFGISRDTLSIAAHGASAFQVGTRQSGILLDDWTEEIPSSKEITGISFRFNQPNAAPPQTLLLAITPEETGSWNWDDLVGTLVDTLDRAKRRAVEPEQLEKQGSVWNALWPALVSEFSTQYESDVSLDLMVMYDFAPLKQYYATQIKTN